MGRKKRVKSDRIVMPIHPSNKQKHVKKKVTLEVRYEKNEKGNFKLKKRWIHEIIEDKKK